MKERPTDTKIVGLLTRAGAWLCTTSITERAGLSTWNVHRRLKVLEEAGRIRKRTDPEDERRVQWRAAE